MSFKKVDAAQIESVLSKLTLEEKVNNIPVLKNTSITTGNRSPCWRGRTSGKHKTIQKRGCHLSR
jgi:hypothetical protein